MAGKEVLKEKEAPRTLQMVTLNFLLRRMADNLSDFVQVLEVRKALGKALGKSRTKR
jgi:hypothetical protein